MRQVVVSLKCDAHLDRDPNAFEPARPVLIALDGAEPRLLDLCDVDEKELVEQLRLLIDRYGYLPDDPGEPKPTPEPAAKTDDGASAPTPIRSRRGKGGKRGGRKKSSRESANGRKIITSYKGIYLCPPELNCERAAMFKRVTMEKHVRKDHDVELTALEGQYGNLNHVEDPEYVKLLTRYKCRQPECTEGFADPKWRTRHERKEHGMEPEDVS